MASSTRAVFVLALILLATVSTNACNSCAPAPPKPKPCPSPPVTPPVTPSPPKQSTCPLDTLKLGVCADVLGLVNVVIGSPPTYPCCSLLKGLVDLEAALCLCTAIKANILGINLNVPISLSVLLSACQKTVPPGFQCP